MPCGIRSRANSSSSLWPASRSFREGAVASISGSADGFLRYGALRATHVGRDFAIVDWSYQTDPGNPQLIRVR